MELVSANEEQKARERDENRPKNRRLTRIQQMVGQHFNNKQRALVAIAQAHQNFASMWG